MAFMNSSSVIMASPSSACTAYLRNLVLDSVDTSSGLSLPTKDSLIDPVMPETLVGAAIVTIRGLVDVDR